MSCPTEKQLSDLIDGKLSHGDQARMITHLGDCEECQRRAEEIAEYRTGEWSAPSETELSGTLLKMPFRFHETRNDVENADFPEDLRFLSPSTDPEYVGRLGNYQIIEEIGRGGMGIVLKAYDPSLRRLVAIKVLAPELATNAGYRKRFSREAHAAAAISDHEHVVTIHAIENTPGELPFIVMQLVGGPSLQQRLRDEGQLEVREVLRVASQTAEALAFAHGKGMVHRDIKPANILLENGVARAKLTDFGLARAIYDPRLTRTGAITGTLEYMAPEQARGDQVDFRADLYSLGAVMYALCTGRPPLQGSTPTAILRKLGEERPVPPSRFNDEVPEWLDVLIMKLLDKNPSRRYGSASEVARKLQAPAVQADGVRRGRSARPTAKGNRPPNWKPFVTRHALSWMAIAGVLVVAIVAYIAPVDPVSENGEDRLEVDAEGRIVITNDDDMRNAIAKHETEQALSLSVKTNDSIGIGHIDLPQTDLELVSADGFSPSVELAGTSGTCWATESRIELDGLRLVDSASGIDGVHEDLFHLSGADAQLVATNCRFESHRAAVMFRLTEGAGMALENCEVLSDKGLAFEVESVVGEDDAPRSVLDLRNCMIAAPVVVRVGNHDSGKQRMVFSSITAVADYFLDMRQSSGADLSVEADHCLLKCRAVFQFAAFAQRDSLFWTGGDNFLAIDTTHEFPRSPKPRAPPNMAMWLNLIGRRRADGTFTGIATFANDLLNQSGHFASVTDLAADDFASTRYELIYNPRNLEPASHYGAIPRGVGPRHDGEAP